MNVAMYLAVLFCFLHTGQALSPLEPVIPECPLVKCSTMCKEFVYENGCQTCKCKVPACQPVRCRMYCKYGWAVNEDGCEVCKCRLPCDGETPLQDKNGDDFYCGRGGVSCPDKPSSYCDIHPADRYAKCCKCKPVLCKMYCKHGWAVDDNGCEICKCRVCKPVLCKMFCKYGWAVDEDGCEICKCKKPCDGVKPLQDKNGVDLYCGRGGVRCPDKPSSYCDIHPTDRYAKCCPKCSPVMCEMYCEHGFQVNEHGCEICKCRQCPKGVELVACLKDPCGGATCSNPSAKICKANYCGGCNAVWYDSNNQEVSCSSEI